MQLTLPQISEPLKLWEKLEIIVSDGDTKGQYLARIEDFFEDGIVISAPEFQEGNTLLRDNCEVIVLVIKEDAVYQFYATLSRLGISDNDMCVLSLPREIRRVQRRQFVRIELVSSIAYADVGSKNFPDDVTWHDSVSLNVSGGGMLIRSHTDVDAPNILLLKADILGELGISQPIAAICRRSYLVDGHHHSGIEFIRNDSLSHHFYREELAKLPRSVEAFDHKAQNTLVTYVFQKQIELRKKGLL